MKLSTPSAIMTGRGAPSSSTGSGFPCGSWNTPAGTCAPHPLVESNYDWKATEDLVGRIFLLDPGDEIPVLRGSSYSRIGNIENPSVRQVALSFDGHVVVAPGKTGAEYSSSNSYSASNSISFVSHTIFHRIEHSLPCRIIESADNSYSS